MEFHEVLDDEVIEAFQLLAHQEGILAALESSHAVAYVAKSAREYSRDTVMVVNLSGRADKDIFIIADAVRDEAWRSYCEEFAAGKYR